MGGAIASAVAVGLGAAIDISFLLILSIADFSHLH